MKTSVYSILILLAIFLFTGCEKEETPYVNENDRLYIGYWEETGRTDSTTLFKRTADLADDKYAFGIFTDGTFIENKNAGFCGTPPITYAQYDGVWLETSDDTLFVNTSYWGGEMDFNLIIKSVSYSKLEVKMENIRMDITE